MIRFRLTPAKTVSGWVNRPGGPGHLAQSVDGRMRSAIGNEAVDAVAVDVYVNGRRTQEREFTIERPPAGDGQRLP